MEIPFETYGPFTLKRERGYAISTEDIQDFWDEIEETEDGLGAAIGIYVISVKHGKSQKPWYVGKTDNGFRYRLIQHARDLALFPSLSSHAPRGNLQVVFIARRTSNGDKFKPSRTSRKSKGKVRKVRHDSIDFLESLIIGACVAQNKRLLNIQKMSKYRDIVVPGLMNEKKGKPSSPAAYLKRLLA